MRILPAILALAVASARVGREQHALTAGEASSAGITAVQVQKAYIRYAVAGFGYDALGGKALPPNTYFDEKSIPRIDAVLRSNDTELLSDGHPIGPCPALPAPPVDQPLTLLGLPGATPALEALVAGKVTIRLWCGTTAADPRVQAARAAFMVAALALEDAAGAWALPNTIVNILPTTYHGLAMPFNISKQVPASITLVSFDAAAIPAKPGAPAPPTADNDLRVALRRGAIYLSGRVMEEVPKSASPSAGGGFAFTRGGNGMPFRRSVADAVYDFAPDDAAHKSAARASLAAIANDAKVMREVCHLMYMVSSPLSYFISEPAETPFQQNEKECKAGVSQLAAATVNECFVEICVAKALGLAINTRLDNWYNAVGKVVNTRAFVIKQSGPAGIKPVFAKMLTDLSAANPTQTGWGWKNDDQTEAFLNPPKTTTKRGTKK